MEEDDDRGIVREVPPLCGREESGLMREISFHGQRNSSVREGNNEEIRIALAASAAHGICLIKCSLKRRKPAFIGAGSFPAH